MKRRQVREPVEPKPVLSENCSFLRCRLLLELCFRSTRPEVLFELRYGSSTETLWP